MTLNRPFTTLRSSPRSPCVLFQYSILEIEPVLHSPASSHRTSVIWNPLEPLVHGQTVPDAEVLALKHRSRILGQWSKPVSGSRKSQASSLWAKQHRVYPIPTRRNHMQGWMNVRESYSRALEQRTLLLLQVTSDISRLSTLPSWQRPPAN